MRRAVRITLLATAALTLLLLLPLEATGQRTLRPDLEVTAVQEPPDFAKPGQRFVFLITVANEGRRTAGRSRAQLYFSRGRTPDDDDIKVGRSIRVPRLAPGRTYTARTTVTIPNGLNAPRYFLFGCADDGNDIAETDNLHNCRLSGQEMNIGDPPVGLPGPNGPNGANGGNGPNSAGLDATRRIARTELPLGRATVDLAQFPDAQTRFGNNQPDEGSTQATDLIKVDELTLRAICRRTSNGDGNLGGGAGDPDDPPDQSVNGRRSFDQDGDEAKILVETAGGTVSFMGPHGPRFNVPAGSGVEPGSESRERGGEGAHQLIVAMQDPDPNTTAGTSGSSGGQTLQDFAWRAGWQAGSIYIATSGGTEIIANLWAGIDVLGIGNDRCVFGGSVYVVKG